MCTKWIIEELPLLKNEKWWCSEKKMKRGKGKRRKLHQKRGKMPWNRIFCFIKSKNFRGVWGTFVPAVGSHQRWRGGWSKCTIYAPELIFYQSQLMNLECGGWRDGSRLGRRCSHLLIYYINHLSPRLLHIILYKLQLVSFFWILTPF